MCGKFCPNVGTPLSLKHQTWTVGDRSYLSFTITSGSSGVYKVALYVTEDGYLWTNAFNWQHLFNIGEDACGRIIHYAKENSTEVEHELYEKLSSRYTIEITEEYILVDDLYSVQTGRRYHLQGSAK